MKNIKIFIGYDSKEPAAYHTCVQSIIEHSSKPLSITPLKLSQLKEYKRTDVKSTVEFSLTRFLVPYLSGFQGWSLFMDCDMIVQTDLSKLLDEIHEPGLISWNMPPVYVCPHDYVTKVETKATGKNEHYPRKNWSSFMLFNNMQCVTLSPEYVNYASPAELHRLQWAKEIGELPLEYNWLVGEYKKNADAKVLHYTLGTPCFEGYEDGAHSDIWYKYFKKAIHPLTPETISRKLED
jgi:lipopolysaccharide biosynthesis glycosyltransferase